MTIPDSAVVALVAGMMGIMAGYVTQRMARGAAREVTPAQIIERLDVAEARLDASLRRERLRDNYIHQLRDHITSGNPPPPPPWPDGLTT